MACTCTCPANDCVGEYCDVCERPDLDCCPHDWNEVLVPTLEALTDLIKAAGFEPVVLAVDGSEPFASLDLGDGFWLDLTAEVREA